MKELPPFRLCNARYWEEVIQQQPLVEEKRVKIQDVEVQDAKQALHILC